MLRPRPLRVIQAVGAAGLAGLAFAICMLSLNNNGTPVELFNWGSFEKQQAVLSNKVEAAIMQRGRNVVQQLHEIKDMVRPRRAWGSSRRKTIPMDEELAMLKVHDQMRKEAHFAKDRITGAGDVTAIVNEVRARVLAATTCTGNTLLNVDYMYMHKISQSKAHVRGTVYS
jgi:hypothetical protein